MQGLFYISVMQGLYYISMMLGLYYISIACPHVSEDGDLLLLLSMHQELELFGHIHPNVLTVQCPLQFINIL